MAQHASGYLRDRLIAWDKKEFKWFTHCDERIKLLSKPSHWWPVDVVVKVRQVPPLLMPRSCIRCGWWKGLEYCGCGLPWLIISIVINPHISTNKLNDPTYMKSQCQEIFSTAAQPWVWCCAVEQFYRLYYGIADSNRKRDWFVYLIIYWPSLTQTVLQIDWTENYLQFLERSNKNAVFHLFSMILLWLAATTITTDFFILFLYGLHISLHS